MKFLIVAVIVGIALADECVNLAPDMMCDQMKAFQQPDGSSGCDSVYSQMNCALACGACSQGEINSYIINTYKHFAHV